MTKKVRPEYGSFQVLKAARHPLLEQNIKAIPNNVVSYPSLNFHVVTGGNMSGKSIYVRQIPLLSIMAQIGCFVPCEYACFKLFDSIFTRINIDDDMEANLSSFMMEMRDLAYIIENADHNSLVILDELGRGTSPEDGIAMTIACCEEILKKKVSSLD